MIYATLIRSVGSVLLHACAYPEDPQGLDKAAQRLAGNERESLIAVRRWAGVHERDIITSLQREFAYRVASGVEALMRPEYAHILQALQAGSSDHES